MLFGAHEDTCLMLSRCQRLESRASWNIVLSSHDRLLHYWASRSRLMSPGRYTPPGRARGERISQSAPVRTLCRRYTGIEKHGETILMVQDVRAFSWKYTFTVHSVHDSIHSVNDSLVHSLNEWSIHLPNEFSINSLEWSIHSLNDSSIHSLNEWSIYSLIDSSIHSLSDSSIYSLGDSSVPSLNKL